ncbi:MAG: tetratricopeptide repeat protein [Deltaproteobacteria bacterium]|nr:tetratricopeptide repeat protein [Deltaproteobacteria bacterium]
MKQGGCDVSAQIGVIDTDWRRRGAVHFLAGRIADAALAFEKAVSSAPEDADALAGLALARFRQGRLEESAICFAGALQLRPNDAATLVNLGNLEVHRKRPTAAEAYYRRALAAAPDCIEAWNNLGNLCQADGRMDQAQKCYQRVLQIDSRYASALNNLGNLYQKSGRFEAAEKYYRCALSIRPKDFEALSNVGQCLRSQGRLTEALSATDEALQENPGFDAAHNNRGLILQDQGRIQEAIGAFDKAIALSPKNASVRSNRLFAMHYDRHTTPADHLRAARRWWTQHGTEAAQQVSFQNDPDPFRKLRIGFVSGDFRSHSVVFFLMPLFDSYDRQKLEIHCYAEVESPDETTARFLQSSCGWHSTVGQDATTVAGWIRSDRIDILIDLAGHTGGNRLDVFALRPAPIQMTWLGYPGTTGSPVIDYRITDAVADPPGESDAWHSEQLLRLPKGFLCYQAAEEAPPVALAPIVRNDYVTFGSFNTLPKLNFEVIEAWATLLRRVQGSRLLIKCRQLADADTCQRLRDQFASLGVSAHRIRFMPKVEGTKGHLAMYHEVDIGLDPFPYNGTTTTCETLWMGVPVVTLCGDRHSGRVGASILSRLGLESLIAQDEEEYVEQAAALARDAERLIHLRRTLRRRMLNSPLCNGSAFSRSFEGMLGKTWIDWCGGRMLQKAKEECLSTVLRVGGDIERINLVR